MAVVRANESQKRFLRWLLLFPAIILAILGSWELRNLGLSIALSKCPRELISPFFFWPQQGYFKVLVVADSACGASWYPAANRALLVGAILLSGLIAGAIGLYLAPGAP